MECCVLVMVEHGMEVRHRQRQTREIIIALFRYNLIYSSFYISLHFRLFCKEVHVHKQDKTFM